MRLPRGWWRPAVLYGGVVALAMAARGARDPLLLLGVAVAIAPIVLLILLRNARPPARFLRGLRDAGVPVEVERDEMGWSGERRMRVRTPSGEWRVECWAAGAIHLRVRGPGMKRIREVRGDARRAGQAAVDGALPRELLRGA